MSTYDFQLSRRRLLAFMAAGGALGIGDLWAQDLGAQTPNLLPDPMIWAPRRLEPLIASPRDAINVFDFEPLAHANVPPAHFAYMASGIGDEVSLRANREGFQHFRLMPRRLIDVSRIDMTMNVFGESYASPIMLAPAGGHLAFHADGEAGTARAAKVGDHPMILSSMTSMPIETVIAERGRPIWYQLYPTDKFEIAKALLAHAERAGCTVAAVTVDVNGPRLQETLLRVRPTDKRPCLACHNTPNGPGLPNGKLQPMWEGVDISGIKSILAPALDWEKLKRIRDTTRMKCVIKGILSPDDAKIAVDAGYDGIIVSNHGGRADESGLSTIEALPGIASVVGGRIPILIDSGFRRGTDILKAIGMGATGVAIGRPYLWGLGAFGQAGVERVLELLRLELKTAMQQVGAPNLAAIKPAMVQHI